MNPNNRRNADDQPLPGESPAKRARQEDERDLPVAGGDFSSDGTVISRAALDIPFPAPAAAYTVGSTFENSLRRIQEYRVREASGRAARRDKDLMVSFDAVTFQTRGCQKSNALRASLATLAKCRHKHGYIGLCAEVDGGVPRLIAYRSCEGAWVLASVEERRRRPSDRPRLFLNGSIEYPDLKSMLDGFYLLAFRARYPIVLRNDEALDYAERYVISVPPPSEHRWNPGCYWVIRSEEDRLILDRTWLRSPPNDVFDLMDN